jgi:hypothetical protein
MKFSVIKLIFFLTLLCCSAYAQKKDSLIPKTNPVKEIKEDQLQAKKRKFTYFVSDRLSHDDKFDIFKITPTEQSPYVIIVRGHIEVVGAPKQKKARITVYNASNNEMVGVYNSNGFTGNYILVLVANVKYIFNVEVSGYGNLKEEVEVPLKIDYEICQQDMKIKLNEKNKPVLLVHNFFTDEHEKMFYIKASGDTSRVINDSQGSGTEESNPKISKNVKNYSTIDELVKKQVEEERKKPGEALNAFKSNDFENASVLYGALLKNDPGDPFANYYYGISLLKLNRNKARAINSLQLASNFKEMPYDVFLYLGKAYHLSYIFQDAILALEEYKKRAQPIEIERNNLNQLIKNCKSGTALMSDPINIEVVKRIKLTDENLLSAYSQDLIEEKIRYKTEFFNSGLDKKKSAKLLVCNFNKQEYFHASYGEKEGTGTDLYKNLSMPAGTIGASQSLGAEINTPYDEDYPYISKDGLTLYFSSKGHNSMGGFDIFKCTRTETSGAWSKPENLGYPINSTYDDILFVPDTSGQFGSFCSNRKNNKYEFIRIKMPHGALSSSVIKGSFTTLDSVPTKDAIISVFNSNTGEVAGVYRTNPETGRYLMILVAGIKYDMTVDVEDYPEYNTTFEIPEKKGEFTLKQVIKFKKESEQKSMKVNNYFMEEEASRITFEDAPKHNIAEHQAKDHELKKELKSKKPERTPEQKSKDQEDLKLAKDMFDQANYQQAALIYQSLEQHIDLDAANAYNHGLSLYYSKKDKSSCIKALEYASNNKSVPIDVFYFLGKANHLSYRFADAIKSYNKFTSVCKPAEAIKLNINKEIEYCDNGIKLVNNPVVMEVYERKHIDINALQNSLTHIESGAKILVLTDDMRSSIDKKKNYKSLLFLSADKNTLLYSSYGEDESRGKDIYRLRKLSTGKWSPAPENITKVNSSFDDEYPALSKDGKTLYFSSKGFDNMGGYDIFKSTWDEKMETWSAPVNLGSPINSPYDDIYFLE